MRRSLVWLALAAGCSSDPVELETQSSSEAEPVDLRREFPDPPAGGAQFLTPDYVIEPHSEIQWCWFGSYDGPTMGIHTQWSFQSLGGHHITINATNADPGAYPDGTVVDCTDPDALPMTDLDPLVVGGDLGADNPEGPSGIMALPEGTAAELEGGRRIILQSHYVNTTADRILVRDAINLELIAPEAVETWAAPVVHVDTDMVAPMGESTLSFDCTFDRELDLLFIGGHMHEWGTAFSTELVRAGGERTTLYDIPEWDPVFRDAPPYIDYAAGELHVGPGDAFTTNCAWNNDTDHDLTFPEEMCVTFAMAYPLKVPIICDP